MPDALFNDHQQKSVVQVDELYIISDHEIGFLLMNFMYVITQIQTWLVWCMYLTHWLHNRGFDRLAGIDISWHFEDHPAYQVHLALGSRGVI